MKTIPQNYPNPEGLCTNNQIISHHFAFVDHYWLHLILVVFGWYFIVLLFVVLCFNYSIHCCVIGCDWLSLFSCVSIILYKVHPHVFIIVVLLGVIGYCVLHYCLHLILVVFGWYFIVLLFVVLCFNYSVHCCVIGCYWLSLFSCVSIILYKVHPHVFIIIVL